MATEAIVQEEMHRYSDHTWYVVKLQQRAELGPVKVPGVMAEYPGFVGCTEISYLVHTQLVAELTKALSAIQPIPWHGYHAPRDRLPGQRTCLFTLPEPALMPRGQCRAVVVKGVRECGRYCLQLSGRELVLM